MYTVNLINMGTTREFKIFDAASEWCIRACFEASIYHCGQCVARFSPISGLHTYFN